MFTFLCACYFYTCTATDFVYAVRCITPNRAKAHESHIEHCCADWKVKENNNNINNNNQIQDQKLISFMKSKPQTTTTFNQSAQIYSLENVCPNQNLIFVFIAFHCIEDKSSNKTHKNLWINRHKTKSIEFQDFNHKFWFQIDFLENYFQWMSSVCCRNLWDSGSLTFNLKNKNKKYVIEKLWY